MQLRPRKALSPKKSAGTHVALAAGLVLLSTSFAPREADADPLLDVGKGDVGVQADKLEIDVATGSAILTGQVVLSKGDMAVRCPRVELKFDASPHLNWAKGSGGVVADVRGVHGEAPEVELDMKKQILELRGGVRLSRGQGWIQADKATIELANGKVTATQVKGSIPVPKP
ncbi:MAG: lipopolysaccharide export system protein LptA [Myxococcales bacterium]|jgi:lipopolysaccharide transport protein LptA|nr:lipopolysaccharide export system protein LptA [Myxococcales bacterium]